VLWELPGPHRFVTDIVRSLERHQHALVVLPRWFGSAGLPWEIGRTVRGLDLGELTVLRIESCGLTENHVGVRSCIEIVGKRSVR